MSTKDTGTAVDSLLQAIRHPLSQHTELQVSAAQGKGWKHDRLPAEAHTEFMRVLEEAKEQAEELVLAGRIHEASGAIDAAWKACDEIWQAAFPPDGWCLEMDAGRHWFVVVTGAFRAYTRRMKAATPPEGG